MSGPTLAEKLFRCGNTFSQFSCGANAQETELSNPKPASNSNVVKLKDTATDSTKAQSEVQSRAEQSRAAIVASLKDPESARFEGVFRSASIERQFSVLDGPMIKTSGFNGYVNAKNAMGGYTGEKLFFCWLDYETETRVLSTSILD